MEERTNLPIFEELENSECGQNNKSVHPAVIKNQQEQYNTKTLLEEFETVLEDVEACHQIIPSSVSTLTPPQSPPPNKSLTVDTKLLVTLQPVQMIQPVISSQQQQLPVYNVIVSSEKQQQQPAVYQNEVCIPEQWNHESVSLDPLGGEDVANDLAVVDEYVRSHTEDIPTAYSSCTSPSGSCASSEDSISDDPDWIADISYDKKQSTSIGKKNQYKPYSRPTIEDKKVRKKEQNKNAATRYRQKKKQEIKDILGEEHELTEYNEKLQGQVKDLQREIGYLKGLMRDLFKAKGFIK